MSVVDDIERTRSYGYRRFWLNVAAYAVTGLLAWFAISFIPSEAQGAERKGYYAVILVAGYFFGRFLNWFVLVAFKQDISK